MLKRFLLAAAVLLLAGYSHAQITNGLAGQVIDYDSRMPVVGLSVCVVPKGLCTLTDEDGRFMLAVSRGDTLQFRGMGYDRRVPIGEDYVASEIIWGFRQDPFALSGVVVEGYLAPASNVSAPGSFGVIRQNVLTAGDPFSLQQAMNTIPGVSLENRGIGGSQRIQIRGSFLRAPFAVRNVKMYMNGIPLSSPDGTAPLELIDQGDIRSVEVVKGPAGSAWGSGTGGVMLFRAMEADLLERSATHQQTWGDFGLRRFHTSAAVSQTRWGVRFSHVYQENDGYRDQEFNRKQQATLTARVKLGQKWDLFNYTTYYTGHWALPGALTAVQVQEDPSQAVPFSEENNSSVYRRRLFTGFSATYRPNDHASLLITTYLTSTTKYNPYGTSVFFNGFKDEGAGGAGGRVTYSERWKTGRWHMEAEGGGEIQVESFYLDEYRNAGGLPGDHQFSYDAGYVSLLGFAGWSGTWNNRLRIQAGLSSTGTIHNITAYAQDWEQTDTVATWRPNWLPRIGTALRIDSLIWWNASISYGVSNPTIFEQIDPAVMIGPGQASWSSILPERGVNYETGFKGTEKHTGIEFEATAYVFLLRDIILPFADSIVSSPNPTIEFTRYRNEGSTRQQGLEAVMRKSWRLRGFLERLDLQATFTRSDYRFNSYPSGGDDFRDRLLPGLALHQASGLMQLFSRGESARLSVQYFWNDRMPLNKANTAWMPAWNLLNVRGDFRVFRASSGTWEVIVHGGVNNLLDTQYTSFPNLNDERERFYNPGPPLHIYGGIRIAVIR